MVKTSPVPCSKEEMDRLIEASMDHDFYHMLYVTAKTTGRRLGEFYGVQLMDKIGKKIVGRKTEYDEHIDHPKILLRAAIHARWLRLLPSSQLGVA